MMREAAETIGLQALAWMAGNEAVLPVFLGATGTSIGDLAAGAHDPAVLASVLDFILTDDAFVIAFCDSAGLPYTSPLSARALLPGGETMHWT